MGYLIDELSNEEILKYIAPAVKQLRSVLNRSPENDRLEHLIITHSEHLVFVGLFLSEHNLHDEFYSYQKRILSRFETHELQNSGD